MGDSCPHCGVLPGECHAVGCPRLPPNTFGSLAPHINNRRLWPPSENWYPARGPFRDEQGRFANGRQIVRVCAYCASMFFEDGCPGCGARRWSLAEVIVGDIRPVPLADDVEMQRTESMSGTLFTVRRNGVTVGSAVVNDHDAVLYQGSDMRAIVVGRLFNQGIMSPAEIATLWEVR